LIVKSINTDLNNLLQTLPFLAHISKNVELDYSLASPITFTANSVTLPLNGEFYEISNHQECPWPRVATPDTVTQNMLQVILSDYLANSAGFVYLNNGNLQVNITNDEVPSWSPITLNTSDWRILLPNLYAKFPNDDMVINLVAAKPPVVVFSPTGGLVSSYGYLTAMPIVNGIPTFAFSLNGTVQFSATISIKGNMIIPNLAYLDVDFSLYESAIGHFDTSFFDSLLNTLFADGIVPVVNGFLSAGFPIPIVEDVQLVNPAIGWQKDYLYIASDIKYSPGGNVEEKIKIN